MIDNMIKNHIYLHYMKIKEWNPEDRPREKLLSKGAEQLSDAELLAVLFGTGSQGTDCLDWSRARLAESGGLKAFFNQSSRKLLSLPGCGTARVAQIIAVREMAARFVRSQVSRRTVVNDPEILADYLRLSLGNQKREKFRVFFLNKKLEILDEKDLFIGTVDETPVYPREIVESALSCHATALILAHNHPSGRLQPSPEDLRVTQKIVKACSLVDIRVMDHVIVGEEGYFSFCNEGLMPSAEQPI